jgi:hypothetical protein
VEISPDHVSLHSLAYIRGGSKRLLYYRVCKPLLVTVVLEHST